MLLLVCSSPVFADDIHVSDGNEDFAFNAFIRDKDVIDGTADWDKDDEPGNDSGPKNGIVRTFDTVTYPVKVTVNPKKNQVLKNIELKISGKLHDGFKDGRGIGNFAIGNHTEMIDEKNGDVTFEQSYTLERSGNAVMIPVTVEVQGAKPNQEIYPDYIKVEVVSVDGKKVNGVSVSFNQLKKIKVSAKVNVGVRAHTGIRYVSSRLPYQMFDPFASKEDRDQMYAFSYSIAAKSLNGKSSVRGSTFPSGRLKFRIKALSTVNFSDHGYLNRELDATSEAPELFSVLPITPRLPKQIIGNSNTLSEQLSYYQNPWPLNSEAARSELINKATDWDCSVWNSGVYRIDSKKIQDNRLIYEGTIDDYVIGNTFPRREASNRQDMVIYGPNEKVFSTQRFLFKSKNLFSYKNEHNPYEYDNQVNSYFTMEIISYTDEDGNEIPLNVTSTGQTSDRNEFGYGTDLSMRFLSIDGHEIGTPNPSWTVVPQGDEAVLGPQDVRLLSMYSIGPSRILGGAKIFFKWNPDSFYMDKLFADRAKSSLRVYWDYFHQCRTDNSYVYFGVPKQTESSFETLGKNTMDDYDWYEDFNDAQAKGNVSAVMADYKEALRQNQGTYNTLFLHTKTSKLGSLNEKGTPNVAMFEMAIYEDKERKKMYYHKETYENPSYYDENGQISKLQIPVRSSIGFDTLGILDAKTSVNGSFDKQSYYISESPKVTIKSGVTFADGLQNSLQDTNIKLDAVLAKCFSYQKNSAYYEKNGKKVFVEPVQMKASNSDTRTRLSWDYLISKKDTTIPDIHFALDVNPLYLDGGVVTSGGIFFEINSSIDRRPLSLRSNRAEVTLLKVGQVGVRESIEKDFGDKNSDYTLHLRPYTTIEDEYGVKGLTHVPSHNDKYGSQFSGTTWLKDVSIQSEKELKVYVNQQVVDVKDPNQVDVTKDGWMSYEDAKRDGELSKTKSIYFVIPGMLSNKDQPLIDLTFGTKDNQFHDIYYNSVLTNSDTHYPVSPISNKVSYQIKAQLELAIRKIQIYTADAKKGLPVKVYLDKSIMQEIGKQQQFELNLYRKDGNSKLASKVLSGSDDVSVVSMKIPSSGLSDADVHSYEARIEGYDSNRVYAIVDKSKVDTEGYTASKQDIYSKDEDLNYKGVVMTEREVGFDMVKYYETIHVPVKKLPKTKTGYGYSLNDYQINYTNELGYKYVNIDDYKPELQFNRLLIDKTLSDKFIDNHGYTILPLEKNGDSISDKSGMHYKYQLPEVMIHQNDGFSYLKEDVMKLSEIKQKEYLDGGRKLYIPIWLKDLGNYDIYFGGGDQLGVNQVRLTVEQTLNVYAYMYEASHSKSINHDEVMLKPNISK